MKKILTLMLCFIVFVCNVTAFAAGGAVNIGDTNGETLFTGSSATHSLILSSNGVVSAWGNNSHGQCGAEACDYVSEINYIEFEDKITKVAAGDGFSIALDENNVAWGWGDNEKFQLGISRPTGAGTPTHFFKPQEISGNIVDIAAGTDFSILLTEKGEVLFSGMKKSDVLKKFELPLVDNSSTKIKKIAANYNNAVAIGNDNTIFLWKSEETSARVVQLSEIEEVQNVIVGKEHFVIRALKEGNIEFYSFGDNSKKQLGVSTVENNDVPILTLSIPFEENEKITEFAGEYYTIVNVWNTLSPNDKVTEYYWGTDFLSFDGERVIKENATEPENNNKQYQIISVSEKGITAFDYINNTVITLGADEMFDNIPLVCPDKIVDTMYEYQYNNIDYHTYKVNFVKLDEKKFLSEKEKYVYWEFVDEHTFRVKVKNFINAIGNSKTNISLSAIILPKEVTGENRTIGAYGPSIWNFNANDELYKSDNIEITHGDEDEKAFTVSCYEISNRTEKPLNITSDIKVFYGSPGEITEKTKLGLYLYGLPKGTSAVISDITDNTFKVILSGNSTSDMDYDTDIKICYIRTSDNQTGECIGDFDLNKTEVFARECDISGVKIKALENTAEKITVSGTLTKGKEDGQIITINISGGEFADMLSPEFWSISGVDGVGVSSIERIDDTNAKVTLSGNSSDKYTDAELKIMCQASQYTDNRVYDEETGSYKASDLISENSVSVKKQSHSTSGGSASSKISNPTSSIKSGEISKGTLLELSTTVKNAKIYYTIDGTEPTNNSMLYQSPIEVDKDMTIKFIAISGTKKSAVQTIKLTVKKSKINLRENAKEIKYIEADNDMFYPDEAMTRYDVLSALNMLFDIEDLNVKSSFTDVSSKYSDLVDLFVGAEIIEGYPDNTFRGETGITRAEFVKILSIMLNTVDSDSIAFSDINGHWCEKCINGFAEFDYLKGYPDETFKPDNIITRAEAIAVLNRIANNNSDMAKITFNDLNAEHWAYEDICKAIITE